MSDLSLMAEHYPELALGSDPVTGLEAFEGVLPLVAPKSGVVRRSSPDRLSSRLSRSRAESIRPHRQVSATHLAKALLFFGWQVLSLVALGLPMAGTSQ
jgi:hypothetical protein